MDWGYANETQACHHPAIRCKLLALCGQVRFKALTYLPDWLNPELLSGRTTRIRVTTVCRQIHRARIALTRKTSLFGPCTSQ